MAKMDLSITLAQGRQNEVDVLVGSNRETPVPGRLGLYDRLYETQMAAAK